jgi:hypothetical protein
VNIVVGDVNVEIPTRGGNLVETGPTMHRLIDLRALDQAIVAYLHLVVSQKTLELLDHDHTGHPKYRHKTHDREHGDGEEHSIEYLEPDWVRDHRRSPQIIPSQTKIDDDKESNEHAVAEEKVELPA